MPVRKGRAPGRGEGSQWRLGKAGSRSAIPVLFTITEEEEGQRRRHDIGRKTKASYYQSEDGRASSATPPGSSASGQIYSPTLTSTPTPTRTAASTSPNNQNTAVKADSLLFNKTDERLRLARERREEREKQNAIKEAEWQAREERARQHYEKHLEERRRKLEEQRIKEEQRRAAVEEKRRQKQEDDKVRHEAVMRRTMERSQVTRPKTNRWSWGGTLPPNSPGTPTGFAESAFLYPLDLAGLEHVHGAFSLSRRYRMMSQYADRRSVSTVNLSKHHDPVITKRLSSSSATLLHSPDRGLQTRATSLPAINKAQSKPRLYRGTATLHKNTGHRRLPLTPWESNVVNRLQQPTHSYLARSRSAMSLTGEQTVSCHPMGSMSFKALQARPLSHSRSHERSLSRETTSSAPARRRTMGTTQSPQKSRDSVRKSWSNLSVPLGPALTLPLKMRTSSPTKRNVKVTAPSPGRPPLKPTGRPPTPKMLKSPGAEDPGNFRPARMTMPDVQRPSTPTKTQETEDEQVLSPPQPLGLNKSSTEQTSTSTSENISSPPTQKTSAGTTDPEEASRIMAENRRLAREQREREEEERRQQEEQARLAKEEMARRKAEERARREEEAHRQAEEKRMKEEEERKMEEERLQKEREEADRAQKQREEEESRQKEQAERLRQERVKHFQKEEAERLERKKRLEEIMKRTRRSDTTEKKPPSKNRDSTVGAASPVPSEGTPSPTPHSNGNRSPPDPNMNASTSTPPLQRENGELEEVIELPSHSRLTPPPNKGDEEEEGQQQQGEVITFRENGLPKPLSGVDDISVQQGADVA
ncbi:ensconsin isoform X2 [Dunckerocampus dactyliophorus]|uniref:ensconsin isoform X2 n=1 Tax=Dunckerocampus dactyliophorus TaxID=161453 RepID=UPI002405C903|nr:ensconsin isoform X2 [Dunckerocampus dactyliophorus]